MTDQAVERAWSSHPSSGSGGPEHALMARVLAALGPVADRAGDPVRDDWAGGSATVDVRSFHVADALVAPERLTGERDPFVATPWTAARSAAYAVLRVLQETPALSPTDAYRHCYQRADGFPWDWLRGRDDAAASPEQRTATAIRALRTVSELVRTCPLEADVVIGCPSKWPFPRRALVLHGRADVVTGNANRRNEAVLHVLTSVEPDSTRWPALAGYEALVLTLQRRRRPAAVVLVHPACGTARRHQVDDDLLDAGLGLAVTTAEALQRPPSPS